MTKQGLSAAARLHRLSIAVVPSTVSLLKYPSDDDCDYDDKALRTLMEDPTALVSKKSEPSASSVSPESAVATNISFSQEQTVHNPEVGTQLALSFLFTLMSLSSRSISSLPPSEGM
jgi:hypothetical protein